MEKKKDPQLEEQDSQQDPQPEVTPPAGEDEQDTGTRLFDTDFEASEDAWEEHLAQQGGEPAGESIKDPATQAQDPQPQPAEGTPDTAPRADPGEGAQPPTSGQAPPVQSGAEGGFYAGRYKTREEVEKGIDEKDALITRLFQEVQTLRQGGQQPAPAQPATQPQPQQGPTPYGVKSKAAELLKDPDFKERLEMGDPDAIREYGDARIDDRFAERDAARKAEQSQAEIGAKIKAVVDDTERSIGEKLAARCPIKDSEETRERRKTYLDVSRKVADQAAIDLLGQNLPVNQLSADQINWRNVAATNLNAYLDKIADMTKERMAAFMPPAPSSERKEVLSSPSSPRPKPGPPVKTKNDEGYIADDSDVIRQQSRLMADD